MLYVEKDINDFAQNLAAVAHAKSASRMARVQEKEQAMRFAQVAKKTDLIESYADEASGNKFVQPQESQLKSITQPAVIRTNPDSKEFKDLLTQKTLQAKQSLEQIASAEELATRPDAQQLKESYARDKGFTKNIQTMLAEEKDPLKRRSLWERYNKEHPEGSNNKTGSELTKFVKQNAALPIDKETIALNAGKIAKQEVNDIITSKNKSSLINEVKEQVKILPQKERKTFDTEFRDILNSGAIQSYPVFQGLMDRLYDTHGMKQRDFSDWWRSQQRGGGGVANTVQYSDYAGVGKTNRFAIKNNAPDEENIASIMKTANFKDGETYIDNGQYATERVGGKITHVIVGTKGNGEPKYGSVEEFVVNSSNPSAHGLTAEQMKISLALIENGKRINGRQAGYQVFTGLRKNPNDFRNETEGGDKEESRRAMSKQIEENYNNILASYNSNPVKIKQSLSALYNQYGIKNSKKSTAKNEATDW